MNDSIVSTGFSFRNDLTFAIWEFAARIRHIFRRHTWVDTEDWMKIDGWDIVTIIGQDCWLCRARR